MPLLKRTENSEENVSHENSMCLTMHSSDPSWKFHSLRFISRDYFKIFSLFVMCLADISKEKNFIYTVFLCRGKSMCVKAVAFHKKKSLMQPVENSWDLLISDRAIAAGAERAWEHSQEAASL